MTSRCFFNRPSENIWFISKVFSWRIGVKIPKNVLWITSNNLTSIVSKFWYFQYIHFFLGCFCPKSGVREKKHTQTWCSGTGRAEFNRQRFTGKPYKKVVSRPWKRHSPDIHCKLGVSTGFLERLLAFLFRLEHLVYISKLCQSRCKGLYSLTYLELLNFIQYIQ